MGHDGARIWINDFTFLARDPWTLDIVLTQREIEERNPAIRNGVGQYARWYQPDGSRYIDSGRGEHFIVDGKTGVAKPTSAALNTRPDRCWGNPALANPNEGITTTAITEGELKRQVLTKKTPEEKVLWSELPYGEPSVPHVADGKVILGNRRPGERRVCLRPRHRPPTVAVRAVAGVA